MDKVFGWFLGQVQPSHHPVKRVGGLVSAKLAGRITEAVELNAFFFHAESYSMLD